MKTIKILFVALLFHSFNGYSQQQRKSISIGSQVDFPLRVFQSNKAIGSGINLKGEFFLSNRFSGTLSAGYSFFNGKLIYWDGTTDKNFALIPLLVGARYYFQKFYLNLEAGLAIKASDNVYTNLAFVPSAGILINRLDLAIRLFSVSQLGVSIPENTFLQKGGYSYLGFRVFYGLNK